MDSNDIELKLHALAEISAILEPNKNEFKQQLHLFSQFIETMYDNLDAAPCYQAFDPADALSFNTPLLETPTPLPEILTRFDENIFSKGIHPNSPFYMGYVPGGGPVIAALAQWLAAATNKLSASFALSPGMVRMQNNMLDWLKQEIGYPTTADGDFTSGGSLAMLTAIIAAREAYPTLLAPNAKRHVAYITSQTHYSIKKALKAAGLEKVLIREVPVDDQYRMDAHKLAAYIVEDKANGLQPWLVAASVGTTNTGAIDPIDAICDICEPENIWVQVDGALGVPFIISQLGKEKISHLSRVNALTLDPHKGFFMPYGLGIVLVKEGYLLPKALSLTADCLQDAQCETMSYFEKSLELSSPARSLMLWFSLTTHGLSAFRAAVEEKLILAQYFYQKIQQLKIPGLRAIEAISPQLSVVAFRFIPEAGEPNAFNEQLLADLTQHGQILLSSTLLNVTSGTHPAPRQWFNRLACGLRAHKQHVDIALTLIENMLSKALNEPRLS